MPAPALDRFEYALARAARRRRARAVDRSGQPAARAGRLRREVGRASCRATPRRRGWAPSACPGTRRPDRRVERAGRRARGRDLAARRTRRDDEPLRLLVAHDGPELDQLARLTDYCAAHIAAGALPRHRVALVAPGDRDQWYSASALYARTLATRVLPAIADAVAVRRRGGRRGQPRGAGHAARAAALPRRLRGALPAVGQLLHAALRRAGVGLRALPADRALRARDAARAAAADGAGGHDRAARWRRTPPTTASWRGRSRRRAIRSACTRGATCTTTRRGATRGTRT